MKLEVTVEILRNNPERIEIEIIGPTGWTESKGNIFRQMKVLNHLTGKYLHHSAVKRWALVQRRESF